MGIPEDAERYNDTMMEEIRIPHTSGPPPPVGEERVRISELDDIAQLAFKGTKSLNRIQSIVFERAYYTNENLLICAPTGAGKTNIAMLAVLREIKSNIENEVIQRDKFKVVPTSCQTCTSSTNGGCSHKHLLLAFISVATQYVTSGYNYGVTKLLKLVQHIGVDHPL